MTAYEPTALIAEMRERTKSMEDLAERLDNYRQIIQLLEQEIAEKDAYIERLRKLAATRGERIRRMEVGEL